MAMRPTYSNLDIPFLASRMLAEREAESPSPSPFHLRQRRCGILSALKRGEVGNTAWARSMHAKNVRKFALKRAEMQAKSTPTMQGPRAEKYAKMAAKKKAQHAKTT